MLEIRESQMRIFREKILEGFEKRRLADIARRFPSRYEELGDDGARAVIETGIQVSEFWGIHAERDVANLVDLMIYFGESFDRDPKLAFETVPLRNSKLPADARVLLTMARMGLEPGFHE
jgi:hypothetical protein